MLDIGLDSPSSVLGGEAFLARVYNAYRSAMSETGSNVWNTALLIGWDEPAAPTTTSFRGRSTPPDPAAPAGEFGFKFDRSGYRVPAILVSPWVESGSVYNEEYRHTSLIATLRKAWGLGDPLTGRDAAARTFDHLFTRDTPRNPDSWTSVQAQPVPEWAMDFNIVNKALSGLGKTMGFLASIAQTPRRWETTNLPPELPTTQTQEITPELIVKVFRRSLSWHFFPAPRTRRRSPLNGWRSGSSGSVS